MTNFDALRAQQPARTHTPTSSTDGSWFDAEPLDDAAAENARRYIAPPTTEGGYSGLRQANVDELDRVIGIVQDVQNSAQGTVEQLVSEVAKQTSAASMADTISKLPLGLPTLAIAGIDGIAGLFGKEFNPAKDAVEFLSGHDEDQQRLAATTQTVERSSSQLETAGAKRTEERAYNFLANVLMTTGLSTETGLTVDGLRDVKFDVVDGEIPGHPGADAQYVRDTNTVQLTRSTMNDIVSLQDKIRAEAPGAIDEDGKLVDVDAYRAAPSRADADKVAGLMVHEEHHAKQARMGISEANAEVAPGEHDVEYPAYLAQEQALVRAGSPRENYVTVTPDGAPLPREQGMANVEALVTGEPLPHGVSAGAVPSPESAGAGGHTHDDGHDHGSEGSDDAGRGWPGNGVIGRGWPGETIGRGWPGETIGRGWPGQTIGRGWPGSAI